MAELINMPRLSDTMEEGNIVSWLKKVGDSVKPGDVLAEVETDKATMDLESFHTGTLLYIGVPEGPIQVGALLAIIGKEGEDISGLINQNGNQPVQLEAATSMEDQKGKSINDSASQSHEQVKDAIHASNVLNPDSRIKISPLAKSIAKDTGINLMSISGSGDGGRIIKSDVEKAIRQPHAQGATITKTYISGKDELIPLSQIRKTIARRLSESKNGAPHFYVTIEVDMENAIQAREVLNNKGDLKISFNDLIVKAVSAALKKHPGINASWTDAGILKHGSINIGVAVAAPEGLMVPVIKNADQKSLSELNSEIKILAGKAKDKKLSLEEMQGNTFTISNLGMFDVESFTAIINPPDACILAVGSIVSKPVVKNNQVVAGNTMKLTLSSDHRLVDGVVAAQFLQTLKQMLENPVFIIL